MYAPAEKIHERQWDRHAIRPLNSTLRLFPDALAGYIKATKPGEHDRERVAVTHYLALPFEQRAEVLAALAE